ncbi:mitotic spindle assembly checkpoint protein MAD1-like [Paramacrobiotus metropolitanus]|uniref:mitotic spindle assembly checkpoint protein MAD1-like n=1 Tax=Paramacrobiotus metropolitanus TaxID=2943436 RepID=UPI00244567C9|nr:mitotic spindle assembly checkpoint protein MAD1-like [Paramacrobiotus metropolitanus]
MSSSENSLSHRRPPSSLITASYPPLSSHPPPRPTREYSFPSAAAPGSQHPGAARPSLISASTPLRPGEKRRGVRPPTVNPNFNQPRGRLTFNAESVENGKGEQRKTAQETPASEAGAGSLRETLRKKSAVKSPERVLATFRRLDGAPIGEGKSWDENLRGENVDSTTKKRRLDSSGELSLNSSLSPGKTTDLIKLEKEITRVTFERDLLKEEVSLERLRTEEKLRKHKQDEDAAMAKAGEMWSQAEKILQENDRLREKMDKAETEGIAMRKQYEEQIAHIKMEHMTRTQQLDRGLREARSENLLLNERFKTASRERHVAVEENHLLKTKLDKLNPLVSELREVRKENQNLTAHLQAKDGQIADLTNANALLANLPEELKQYRELQIKVPLLEKENQKLRERAALARANEDKIQTLEESIKRYETRQCRFYDLELENEQLKAQIEEFESADLAQSPSKKPRGIQHLLDRIGEMELREKKLGDDVASRNQKIGEMADRCRDLEERIVEVKSQLELSEKSKQMQESRAQDLSNKLAAVSTERDTFKLIKETMDQSSSRRGDPSIMAKLRDLEERATRSQTLADNFEQMYNRTSSSESQLKTSLEDLQRRYEAETVRAHEQLQKLTEENEELRTVKEELEERLGEWTLRMLRGEYDPTRTDVVVVGESPLEAAQKEFLAEAGKVLEENKLRQEKLNQVKMGGGYSGDVTVNAEEFLRGPGEQLEELKKQLEKAEKQRNQDTTFFKKSIQSFRHVCRDLLGWNIRYDGNKIVFRVADAPANETIVFEREDENKPWELRSNDYTTANQVFVNEFLTSHQSPPGFFARIILKILSERTLICMDSPTP